MASQSRLFSPVSYPFTCFSVCQTPCTGPCYSPPTLPAHVPLLRLPSRSEKLVSVQWRDVWCRKRARQREQRKGAKETWTCRQKSKCYLDILILFEFCFFLQQDLKWKKNGRSPKISVECVGLHIHTHFLYSAYCFIILQCPIAAQVPVRSSFSASSSENLFK